MLAGILAGVLQQTGGGGGGGSTTYFEHDLTGPTSGAIAGETPDVDESAAGWDAVLGGFVFAADGTGVFCDSTSAAVAIFNTTDRENVRYTLTFVPIRGASDSRYAAGWLRGVSSGQADGLLVRPNTDVDDLQLVDPGVVTVGSWDLSALMSSPPTAGDELTIVVDCNGNSITLVSVSVNGAAAETVNSTLTLTGATTTAHGAGSGADRYGIYSNDRIASDNGERFSYIKVESLP